MTEMFAEIQLIVSNISKRPQKHLRAVNISVYCQYYTHTHTVSKLFASLLNDATIFFPTSSRFIKMSTKHSVIIILNDHCTTTLMLFQFKVCICTLHYIIHYNDSHKNLVSNGDGAKISVFIKMMYKEFKTKHSTQKRLNIAVTPADIKLVKSKRQSSSDQLSLK